MPKIHPTSVVADGAILSDHVEIGPLCYVGPNVKLGAGTRLVAQCHIDGYTTLGEGNTVYPFASLGQNAQDHGVVPGEATYLEIGDRNIFREGCTIHTGTQPGTKTTIGSGCMFMNASHVAHNCKIGNHVIIVGFGGVAGYCEVGDRALISALSGMHQFCRVGRLAIISGGSVFSQDIPPFMMAEGRNGGVKMVNLIGMKRAGFSEETIRAIRNVYKIVYRGSLILPNALAKVEAEVPLFPEVREFLDFCRSSKRGVLVNHTEGHRS